MTFHHVAPSKGFFLTEKNFCFKNFLFKKFFLLIVLAVFSNACSSSSSDSSSGSSGDSSSSSNDQKKADSPSKKPQVSVSTCAITQFQDETGKTQAIVADKEGKGQDIEKGQTLTLFYDCTIVPKDYNKKATLAVSGNTAITTSVTEINIPAQAKIADSFTVTGLKTADTNVQTSIKIKLEKSDVLTQLALTVTPTFVLDPKKVKITTIATGVTLTAKTKKLLAVYQNTLYLLNATGFSSDAKLYSFDGTTWADLGTPQDASDSTKKIKGQTFYMAVHNGKLWVAGTAIPTGQSGFWNFDGKSWNYLTSGKGLTNYGSIVSFQNFLYQIDGEVIQAYDDSQNKWHNKGQLVKDKYFGRSDAVVFDGKIWIPGGRISGISSGASESLQTVASFDGTTYQKNVANLPAKSWWNAVEVFPRGLLAIGGRDDSAAVSAVFYSRFGKNWKNITGIKDQSKLKPVYSGATVVWNGALWAVNRNREVFKITYEE